MIWPFIKYLFLIFIFGIIFSFVPKYVYSWIDKLLTFSEYKEEPVKTRTKDMVVIYLILGLVFGIIFMAAFSLGDLLNIDARIVKMDLFSKNNILLSLLTSFALVFILRIATLLSKTQLLTKLKWLPKTSMTKLMKRNENYKYDQLRDEMASFLFSIALTTILSLLIFVSYTILFHPGSFIHFPEGASLESIGFAFVIILLSAIGLYYLTYAGEWFLSKIGVHPNCTKQIND